MAIDVNALARAAQGNPDEKVAVRRAWLGEVHRQLQAGAQAQAELACLKRRDRAFDALFGSLRRSF